MVLFHRATNKITQGLDHNQISLVKEQRKLLPVGKIRKDKDPMDFFNASNYRELIRSRFEQMPNRGYGQMGRIAKYLGVNQTLVSQVMSGLKEFTEEQGFLLGEYFELNDLETEFLLLLIRRDRAGHHKLKQFFEKQIIRARSEAQKVKHHVSREKELTIEQQSIFYSSWIYSAVHGLTAIPSKQSVEAVASHLGVSRARISEIANWLLRVGLCKELQGRLVVGPKSTFVEKESPLSGQHLSNWHVKAQELMVEKMDSDLFFSAPITVSEKDYAEIRKELVQQIAKISKRVEKSESQILAAFNIDCFIV
jgi:uncharacterized protein (TIGR02147 family)